MKIEEIRKIISESNDPDWFSSVNTPLNLPSINFSHTFVGVPELFLFLEHQCSGWELSEQTKKNIFAPSINFFSELRSTLVRIINEFKDYSESQRNSVWQGNILNKTYTNSQNLFLFECPEVSFLLKVYADFPTAYSGAYNFIVGAVNSDIINKKENLIGTLLAYEFTVKDHSQIIERRNAEKSSISALRNNFGKYISDNEIFMSEFKKDLTQRLINHDDEFNALKEEKAKEFDESREIKKTTFDTWFTNSGDEYTSFYKDSQTKISELENTYREKLKLEEPAIYWSERAAKLKDQGWKSMYILIFLCAISGVFLGVILWNSPDSMLSSWFNNDKSAAIRWSLVFITLLSLIAYAIRAVSKVMFSSFHLARDCEERYTLTYFYLALMKDSQVDIKDRSLIMQSLFSRSDTGLLKEDSSPTMPNAGGIVGGIFKPN